ncbi:BREX system P-loop protein BrxC [Thermoanaerobacterium thermosaccharolyticum]|uniref:BREX system P-loop protein BrxC n=1 Tax=Thermoanaerobacterium thermosaccharolyticum TaxID=1517 RepID=UPI00177D9EA2|nr:BREX system P-loop protein BrxC [Thermoanaerobacterium thermosaccharolyticum]MBE0069728.1 BREX system P-loop protein BrxC [Thermoanaerobacterium thermosaccharolyticum]
MIIKDLFVKDIDRDLNGVIKAEQTDDIYQELDEYVVTDELLKHFNDFFSAYCKSLDGPTDKIGVWISGFFGSGKSHLLKILAYILNNQDVNGRRPVSFFDDKIKDPLLLSEMKRAANSSCDVILFDIDSKAKTDSKVKESGLVETFMRVFDEMQGFYGFTPWIAEFERNLYRDNKYDEFKEAFEAVSGRKWEDRRDAAYFERDNIVKALTLSTGMSKEAAELLFDKAESNYSITIDKFADIVKEYCESRGNDHRVLFFVDEVGQFIGDNSDLMLNLQTIVEDLGIKLKGKAWVVVTSQQDIDRFVKETKNKEYDFSKIQGRFATRINLSSANTDEVIKKRILEKSDVAKDTLRSLYAEKSAVLKNIISFSSATSDMTSYKDENDFIEVYPFVPYQFNLLQNVFEVVRSHGAAGKHISEGERSLLGAFKEAASMFRGKNIGVLIPFYVFYDTIEDHLDSSVKRAVIQAQKNESIKEQDVKLLKLLFLLKYVDRVKANVENLTTLMIDDIDVDKIALRSSIVESLDRLKRENYIQQNGDEYIFLTDVEQDINREIKSVNVDEREIIDEVMKMIFADIYDNKSFKYSSYNVFNIIRQVDGYNYGTMKGDITIKIVTPYFETPKTDYELLLMSKDSSTMILKLPDDTDCFDEVKEYIQTKKYINDKLNNAAEDIRKLISIKQSENDGREKRIKNQLANLIAAAGVYIEGQKFDIKVNNPREKIDNGLKILVENVYTKMNYINVHTTGADDIKKIIKSNETKLSFTEEADNKLAIKELQNYLEEQRFIKSNYLTVKDIIDRFSSKPYGWNQLDIAGLIATMFKGGMVKISYNGEYISIDNKNVVDYLTKNSEIDKAVVEYREALDAKFLKKVKDVANVIFGQLDLPDEEDKLYSAVKNLVDKKIEIIKGYIAQYKNRYPGKKGLDIALDLYSEMLHEKDEKEFFDKLIAEEDDLIEINEELEKVISFYEHQKDIFDSGLDCLKMVDNSESYISSPVIRDKSVALRRIIESPSSYAMIKEIPELVDEIGKEYEKILNERKEIAKKKILDDRKRVEENLQIECLSDNFKKRLLLYFDDFLSQLDKITQIKDVEALKSLSDERFRGCIKEIDAEVYRVQNEKKDAKDNDQHEKPKPIKQVELKNYIGNLTILETEDDVDKFLNQLREKLIENLKEGRIRLL